jgi:hypothetical protein
METLRSRGREYGEKAQLARARVEMLDEDAFVAERDHTGRRRSRHREKADKEEDRDPHFGSIPSLTFDPEPAEALSSRHVE